SQSAAAIAAMLYEPRGVRGERRVDPVVARTRAGKTLEGAGIAGVAELGACLRAERQQLREVGHGGDRAGSGDEHQALREERVAEQERDVLVRRLEQPRASVVEEIALVDRLDADREPIVA